MGQTKGAPLKYNMMSKTGEKHILFTLVSSIEKGCAVLIYTTWFRISDILSAFLLTKLCSKWHQLSHRCQGFLSTEMVLDVEKDVPKKWPRGSLVIGSIKQPHKRV